MVTIRTLSILGSNLVSLKSYVKIINRIIYFSWIILIYFNGKFTILRLFYTFMLGENVNFTFIFIIFA